MCAGFPLGLRIVNSFRVRNLTLWTFKGDCLELLPMMIVLNLGKYVLIIGFAFILGVFAFICTSIHHAVILCSSNARSAVSRRCPPSSPL